MSYTISKQFEFAAAHHLPLLPVGHKCKRTHGHNYVVEVILSSDVLDKFGFVVDYGDLALFKKIVDETLDHRDLNTIFDMQPTAENLARYLFDLCKAMYPQTVCVKVSETPKTWASYRE